MCKITYYLCIYLPIMSNRICDRFAKSDYNLEYYENTRTQLKHMVNTIEIENCIQTVSVNLKKKYVLLFIMTCMTYM